ncbi:MAG: prepilin-type N-terminal cleavage/methylation domain-containing protein [Methylobacter sp.]|uniref:Prepilin-type N-terminal cleavage/methylation domain-containing protein n=1 Tax=Candidatus Methylobacter titanis TaxID=3053457 RepID=A0AA43TL81_9GAMM|nr:prepilin-type N-terminal cleavage/methylation domain-containing protein [Candidatus Methylobacter titanis]
MSITYKQQTGITLIELMIGLLVGMIVVAGGISVFTTSIKGQTDNQQLSRLNQDMRAMMDIMVRDIRRAGFVTSNPDANLASLQNNPFFSATTDIAVWDYDGGSDNCTVYAYNSDNSNPPVVSLPSPSTQGKLFGFRLNSDGILSMRKSGNANNVDCTDGSWETITEPDVEVTDLTFTLTSTPLNVTSMATDSDNDGCYDGDETTPNASNPTTCVTGTYGNGLCDTGEACNTCTRDGTAPDPACLYVRNVAISLTARLRDDNTVTQTITQQVRVRNDKFLSAIP